MLNQSSGDQLREHLLTHDAPELAHYGFNKSLLEDDRDRVKGGAAATARSRKPHLDRELLQRAEQWIRPSHLGTLTHLAELSRLETLNSSKGQARTEQH
jgi:hypothetical protein